MKKINTREKDMLSNNAEIKRTEKKLEISIYALLIIVTIALMLLIFNLFLINN